MNTDFIKNAKAKQLIREWLYNAMVRYCGKSQLAWNDEDSLCQEFLSAISGTISTPVGDLSIKSYKVRGRGGNAPESTLGADGIAIVRIHTSNSRIDGFLLFQAKKVSDRQEPLVNSVKQCAKMLRHTAASYLLVLLPDAVEMVGAMAVAGSRQASPQLKTLPYVAFHRCALEHLLHGIMLAPWDVIRTMSQQLKKDLRYAILFSGSSGRDPADIGAEIDAYLDGFEEIHKSSD